MLYFVVCVALILFLIFYVAPTRGTDSVLVYIAICSLVGSLSVMSVKVPPFPPPSMRSALISSVQKGKVSMTTFMSPIIEYSVASPGVAFSNFFDVSSANIIAYQEPR